MVDSDRNCSSEPTFYDMSASLLSSLDSADNLLGGTEREVDEDDYGDDESALIELDTETFGLPIKMDNIDHQSSNFPDISDEFNCLRHKSSSALSSSADPEKKVRFPKALDGLSEDRPSTSYIGLDSISGSKSSSGTNLSSASRLGSKMDIEQLILSANVMNKFIDKNIEYINMYQSGFFESKSSVSLMSGVQSPNARSAVHSNFELTDLEDCSADTDDTENWSGNDDSLVIQRNHSEQSTGRSSPLGVELARSEELSRDLLDELLIKVAKEFRVDREQEQTEQMEYTCIQVYTAVPLRENIQEVNCSELESISTDGAIQNLIDTFHRILDLSERCPENSAVKSEHDLCSRFIMKNIPSLSFVDFIKRIHDKCHFDTPVYLSATYLLQILFLERSAESNSLELKFKLQRDGLHRLIIALVRISTKLLEDQIHSHDYFSKVCGVTKRLLSKLELSLLKCLSRERLMITMKKLNTPTRILEELNAM
ncbi:Pcl10p KNAG_0F01870 [Huiozyma naganishii CBS 8797]|uniref:Uncharacterized protein n=1 Tax=Huiozyma naganishii (strain ATCC MYA-139 / BCRC 22969 / CBS 8797 / KCTC 17520 / NBRC 10181 / NCYC 3082 / Yp74L-3) TaxID=1071383 RepID=J7R7K7_HUIN7|nr:hypothetical protein KNAG_0F01870 [Kazachstania naganishii CBS 8797]CCK70855.1 hypothetical protein KNAG_0F01870 [Kazachstania naganishii CBS 8797]